MSTALEPPGPQPLYAAYNGWGPGGAGAVSKEIDVYPYNDHEGGGDYRFPRTLAWLNKII